MISIINKKLWQQLFGNLPEGIHLIVDPYVGSPNRRADRAQLRIIPFLSRLGITRFTFPDIWKKYDLIEYEYVKLHDNVATATASLGSISAGYEQTNVNIPFPLCQIISKEIEQRSPYDITKNLIYQSQKRNNQSSELFILVVDSDGFYLKDNQDQKPLVEDLDLTDNIAFFEKIFLKYFFMIDKEPVLSTSETMNLFFHEMALDQYELTGAKPKRLRDLFDYENIPSVSKAWNMLKDFANLKTELEFDNYLRECMRSWVESDVGGIVNNMITALQKCQFNAGKIELWRKDRRRTNTI